MCIKKMKRACRRSYGTKKEEKLDIVFSKFIVLQFLGFSREWKHCEHDKVCNNISMID